MSRYSKREVVQEEVWFDGLSDIFNFIGIEATPQQQKKLFFTIFATIAKFLRNNADHKLSIGFIDMVKRSFTERVLFSVELNNLKECPTADVLEHYYVQGGMECEELRDMIEEFMEDLASFAEDIDNINTERIKRLQALKNKKEK